MSAPLIVVQAQPRRAADGAIVNLRFAGGGDGPYFLAGEHWRAGIAGLPTIVTSIDFTGSDIGGGGVPQAMQIRWAPASAAALAEVTANLHWLDADIGVGIAQDGAFPALKTGKVLSATTAENALVIALADPAGDLRRPLLSDRYAGTGGIEGPAEWAGRIKRRVWGRAYNLAGDCIDPANSIYCFGDPTRAWQAFDGVRDKGAAAAMLTTVPWAGSAAATFAALQAAQAPQGGGVLAPSIACVKWWTEPAGSLTADVRGENVGGYVETAPEIAQRLVQAISTVPFAPGTVDEAIVARPMAVGWVAEDENATVAAMLDQLLGDVSLLWVLDDGKIRLRRWEWGASVATGKSLDVSRTASFKPIGRRRLGYRRNQHVMTRADIAGIVLASDVVLDDGTSLQDIKDALAVAQALAASKSRTFFGSTFPLAAVSSENDIFIDEDDGNKRYRRLPGDGVVSIGGSPVMIGGQVLSEYAWAPTDPPAIANFNARNDRLTSAVAAPVVAVDGTAVDHVLNKDGSANISFEWGWSGDQATIDGFVGLLRSAKTAAPYAFGSEPLNEVPIVLPADRRALIIQGVPADHFYSFAVYAYRDVDPDINPAGRIVSPLSVASGPGEAPYQPSANVAFEGDILGTIQGRDSLALVQNVEAIASDAVLSTAEKPQLKIDYDAYIASWTALDARASALGGFAEQAAATAAKSALVAYLDSLVPSWTNAALNTPIDPAVFKARWTDAYSTLANLSASVTGQPGAPGIAAVLNPPNFNVPAAADGTVQSYAGASGNFQIFAGNSDISAQFTLSTAANPQALTVAYAGQTFTVTAGLDAGEANATLTIRATGTGAYAGVTIDRKFTLGKNLPGAAGRSAVLAQSDLAPENPVVGDTWVTLSPPRIWRQWNGSQWVKLLGDIAALDLVTADMLAVSELSAITANIGEFNTFLAGVLRLRLSANGLQIFYPNGNPAVTMLVS